MYGDMTYQEWEAQQAQWMEGQDELFYKGYKVTPEFDMVMRSESGDLRRVRPQLQGSNCFPTRVKRYGETNGRCPTVWTPKMYSGPVC